jgi:transcriptional regulator with XRE-family HTH domain
MVEFAEGLYALMRKQDITRGELAKGARISKGKLDKIFAGYEKPSNFELKMIAQVLGVDTDSLPGLNGTEPKQKIEPLKHAPNVISAASGTKKTPLMKISDEGCVKCGRPIAGNCHETGPMQFLLGKGLSQKGDNLFTAELCDEHHKEFDALKGGKKNIEVENDFWRCIGLTQQRRLRNGKIIVNA